MWQEEDARGPAALETLHGAALAADVAADEGGAQI